MKKGPLILLVAICSLTMSVAANSMASRTSVCVVDDVGDTKVAKKSEISNVIPVYSYENMQLTACDHAVILENGASIVIKPVSLTYNVVKPNKTEKIYLLNCAIRQCLYRTVSTV